MTSVSLEPTGIRHMTFSTKTLSTVTVFVVMTLVVGGIYYRVRPESGSDGDAELAAAETSDFTETSASEQFAIDVPQPTSGSAAVRDTLWVQVTAAGQAEAFREAVLTSHVEGQVLNVLVRENSGIASGRALLQIDTTEYAMELARARGDLERAEVEYQRSILFDQEIQDASVRAERARISRVQSGLAGAEIDVRQAQINLDRTTVVAPFGGRVADLEVVRGQWVSSGAELLTVVALNPIKVEVQVLEAELGLLAEGRLTRVTFAAFPGETFQGRIETINPRVDPDNRTGRVTVLLDNQDSRIKPGMYAQVTIDAQAFPDRVLIPRGAVLLRDGREMVFVFNPEGPNGRAEWRYVTTGRQNETLVELTHGDEDFVEPGEIVLTDGHHYLAHDATLRLVDHPAAVGGRPGR